MRISDWSSDVCSSDLDILDVANVGVYAVIGGGAWDRLGSRAEQWPALRTAPEAPADAGGKAGGKGDGGGRRRGAAWLAGVSAAEVPPPSKPIRKPVTGQRGAWAGDLGSGGIIAGPTEPWAP